MSKFPKLPRLKLSRLQLPGLRLSAFHKEILHLTGVLLAICAVCAGLLGWVNGMTAQHIAGNAQARTFEALRQVMPDADRFEALPSAADPNTLYSSGSPAKPFPYPITAVWMAYGADTLLGLCVEVAPRGYGGQMTLLVGVDTDIAVTGVRVTAHSETAGLGTKAAEPAWLAQFEGLTGPLRTVRNVKSEAQDIVAVTSATVTSSAVTDGVQAALSYGASMLEQGGDQ